MAKEIQASNDFLIMDCLVLFDEQFSIANFSIALEKAKQQSSDVLNSTREAVRKAFSKLNDDEITQLLI